MLESIFLRSFTMEGSQELYRAYRRLKYDVFVAELSWASLKDESGEPIAREDPFDNRGQFLLAATENGLPIGVLRAIALKDGFPHRNLFEHHLNHPEFAHLVENLCTFNALAVLSPYRGRPYRASGPGWLGGIGRLLMLGLIRSMEAKGLRGAVLTAAGIISLRLFLRLGFFAIDSPVITPLHSDVMINMGIVFGSDLHVMAQEQCGMEANRRSTLDADCLALLRYFQSRHDNAIGPRRLESFFE